MGTPAGEREARFHALDHIEYPELHEESIPEARFNYNLRKIMQVAGIRDFSYSRDLYQPQKQRLKVQLSALINIILYRLDKLASFSEKASEAEQISELRQKIELETQQAQATLRQYRQQQEREEPILKQLQTEIDAQEAIIRQYNSKQATLSNELKECKNLATEKMDKISQVKVSIGNSRQENSKLQSLILQSPEKVKKSLEDMEHSLEGIKANILESSKRSEELQARFVHCCKIEKDIKKCVVMLNEIDQETNKYKKGTKQAKEIKAKKVELQKIIDELDVQISSVQRSINSHSEKAARAGQSNATKKEQAEQTMRELKEEKQKVEKEQAELRPVLEQQAKETMLIQQQMSSRMQEYEKMEKDETTQYRRLVDSVQKFHQNIYGLINAH
eukprot:Phypoly_transcript_08739.p1 GENE.Phypoly_transcript_08739~~Phypoly_transcript_08739.p1  ORF type:complete len:448 (+),score=104.48 Phypoly_transcript_08739:176-1345(+)